MSASLTMLYRSKTDRVLCPLIFIATIPDVGRTFRLNIHVGIVGALVTNTCSGAGSLRQSANLGSSGFERSLDPKVFAVPIMGYILNPIDIIPDFIPVISYVDDCILVPAAIFFLIKMIPKEAVEECREMLDPSWPYQRKTLDSRTRPS